MGLDGYSFLHSGRPVPGPDDVVVRNEGVGILWDERATAAWKEAGEEWKAVSSRIVVDRSKVVSKRQRIIGSFRETSSVYMTVVCGYAPTAKATPNVKEKFNCDLQDVLDKVPRSEVLALLGDLHELVY